LKAPTWIVKLIAARGLVSGGRGAGTGGAGIRGVGDGVGGGCGIRGAAQDPKTSIKKAQIVNTNLTRFCLQVFDIPPGCIKKRSPS
jgi:hypothetical protein